MIDIRCMLGFHKPKEKQFEGEWLRCQRCGRFIGWTDKVKVASIIALMILAVLLLLSGCASGVRNSPATSRCQSPPSPSNSPELAHGDSGSAAPYLGWVFSCGSVASPPLPPPSLAQFSDYSELPEASHPSPPSPQKSAEQRGTRHGLPMVGGP